MTLTPFEKQVLAELRIYLHKHLAEHVERHGCLGNVALSICVAIGAFDDKHPVYAGGDVETILICETRVVDGKLDAGDGIFPVHQMLGESPDDYGAGCLCGCAPLQPCGKADCPHEHDGRPS